MAWCQIEKEGGASCDQHMRGVDAQQALKAAIDLTELIAKAKGFTKVESHRFTRAATRIGRVRGRSAFALDIDENRSRSQLLLAAA